MSLVVGVKRKKTKTYNLVFVNLEIIDFLVSDLSVRVCANRSLKNYLDRLMNCFYNSDE